MDQNQEITGLQTLVRELYMTLGEYEQARRFMVRTLSEQSQRLSEKDNKIRELESKLQGLLKANDTPANRPVPAQ